MLSAVAAVATPGLVTGIVSLLQNKLLALILRILITHPARKGSREDQQLVSLASALGSVLCRNISGFSSLVSICHVCSISPLSDQNIIFLFLSIFYFVQCEIPAALNIASKDHDDQTEKTD